jgi:NAD(P)H-dependent FMN reductase
MEGTSADDGGISLPLWKGARTMKILVLNATYRPKKTTARLAEKALEGAASGGAETEMVMLYESSIGYCTNCLKCYRDLESEIAPCSLTDDMDTILERIRDADGIIFASPVHNGFVTGLMTVFFERMAWRVMRPEGSFLGAMGMKSRLASKTRALASIVNAGGIPLRLRKHCDDGTPWLKGNAPLMLHGQWIGDMYAAAVLTSQPRSEEDWSKLYFNRELSEQQLEEAHALGVRMGHAIEKQKLKPVTLDNLVSPLIREIVNTMNRFRPPYETIGSRRPQK